MEARRHADKEQNEHCQGRVRQDGDGHVAVPLAAPSSTLLGGGQPLLAEALCCQAQILLVEDDPDGRACMSALLELEGYTVVTAVDGAEALERLRNGLQPGLIVLDLMMPGMDGFQFRREQLQDPRLS